MIKHFLFALGAKCHTFYISCDNFCYRVNVILMVQLRVVSKTLPTHSAKGHLVVDSLEDALTRFEWCFRIVQLRLAHSYIHWAHILLPAKG